MSFAGMDGIQALQQIQSSNDTIRDNFLQRTRVLERIRSDLYLSGTYVRDYLLEPESGKADGHRYSLLETRNDMDEALAEYQGLLNAPERAPFAVLKRELGAYWSVLEPTFQWTPAERKGRGYVFLRDEVFPRRTSMLRIADRIASLNESQMNAGKQTVEETFRRSRLRLSGTIALTVVLGLVLAAFSMRKFLELESKTAKHYQEISVAREELKKLSARLVAVQEDERRSISRELHDEVGQTLTGVLVEMANLSTLLRARDLGAAAPKAEEIKKQIENSISVVRNMALLLRPSMLDDLGLLPALEWQAREVLKRNGVWVKVTAEGISEDLPEEHKTCIYRIVQEALHNIVQHAYARNVSIAVQQDAVRLLLTIEDDGKGFNPQRERGMGLLGIQERTDYLGGSFSVESWPGRGTVLQIELPLPAAVPA